MYATFCDSCGQTISSDDEKAIDIERRSAPNIHLCGTCSAGVIEMLKDMRLIRELNTIR